MAAKDYKETVLLEGKDPDAYLEDAFNNDESDASSGTGGEQADGAEEADDYVTDEMVSEEEGNGESSD